MAKMRYFPPCPEPGCGGRLKLKKTHRGRKFYGCENFFAQGCRGTLGALADGSPRGAPSDRRTKRARQAAREAFYNLWSGGPLTRAQAHQWLHALTGQTAEAVTIIIGFTRQECEDFIHSVQALKRHAVGIVSAPTEGAGSPGQTP